VLEQDGREVFRSNGSGQLADVMVKALGIDDFRQMVEVSLQEAASEDHPAISVLGYTSMPDHNRADRTHITLFVNGRYIQDVKLTYAVVQAYHTLLMTGRFPVTVLMLTISPDVVDVNVHPAKAEVRFRDPDLIFAVIQRAVREAVIVFSQTPGVHGRRLRGFDSAQLPGRWGDTTGQSAQLGMDLPLEDAGRYPGQPVSPPDEENFDLSAIPEGPDAPLKPRTLPMLRVVGQVGATYIVAEGPAGMYLIDQHAAHERILYEQFMEHLEKQTVIAQHTLAAQTVELPLVRAQLIEEYLDVLRLVGFDLELFGPNSFLIRAVPAALADSDPLEVIAGIVDDLEQDKQPGRSAMEEKIIRRVCRQAAVKAGQILSHAEAQNLIRQLERCQSPHTCPHGRPTMLHMSSERLAREFGRA